MQNSECNRRAFLRAGALAGCALAAGPALAMGPIQRTGRPRLKLSLAAYSFRDFLPNYRKGDPSGDEPMDMLAFLDYCAGQNLDGAELTSYFLPDPCPASLAHTLKKRAHIHGLEISGGAIGNNFAYPDGPELEAQFAYTERWIKSYAAMGAPVIRVFGGKPKDKAEVSESAERNIIRNLEKACAIAGKHGVILAIENHDFMTDIDRFLRIVSAVESPWFGVNLDSGNFAKTPDPYREFARAAPYAVNVQFKVQIPRNGVKEAVDFGRLVKILRQADYSGYIVLEYEEKEDPYEAIPSYLEDLRKLL